MTVLYMTIIYGPRQVLDQALFIFIIIIVSTIYDIHTRIFASREGTLSGTHMSHHHIYVTSSHVCHREGTLSGPVHFMIVIIMSIIRRRKKKKKLFTLYEGKKKKKLFTLWCVIIMSIICKDFRSVFASFYCLFFAYGLMIVIIMSIICKDFRSILLPLTSFFFFYCHTFIIHEACVSPGCTRAEMRTPFRDLRAAVSALMWHERMMWHERDDVICERWCDIEKNGNTRTLSWLEGRSVSAVTSSYCTMSHHHTVLCHIIILYYVFRDLRAAVSALGTKKKLSRKKIKIRDGNVHWLCKWYKRRQRKEKEKIYIWRRKKMKNRDGNVHWLGKWCKRWRRKEKEKEI